MENYSIIIPVHNEAFHLKQLIKELKPYLLTNEIIIIDDGSTDNSYNIIKESSNNIIILRNEKKRGKGHSIKKGIGCAENEKIILWDGDLEVKTKNIKDLMILDKISGENFILGHRCNNDKSKSLFSFGNYLFTKFLNILFKVEIKDALCFGKAFYKQLLNEILISEKFDIDIEILITLIQTKAQFKEVELNYTRRSKKSGKKIRYFDGLYILKRMILMRFS